VTVLGGGTGGVTVSVAALLLRLAVLAARTGAKQRRVVAARSWSTCRY